MPEETRKLKNTLSVRLNTEQLAQVQAVYDRTAAPDTKLADWLVSLIVAEDSEVLQRLAAAEKAAAEQDAANTALRAELTAANAKLMEHVRKAQQRQPNPHQTQRPQAPKKEEKPAETPKKNKRYGAGIIRF